MVMESSKNRQPGIELGGAYSWRQGFGPRHMIETKKSSRRSRTLLGVLLETTDLGNSCRAGTLLRAVSLSARVPECITTQDPKSCRSGRRATLVTASSAEMYHPLGPNPK